MFFAFHSIDDPAHLGIDKSNEFGMLNSITSSSLSISLGTICEVGGEDIEGIPETRHEDLENREVKRVQIVIMEARACSTKSATSKLHVVEKAQWYATSAH